MSAVWEAECFGERVWNNSTLPRRCVRAGFAEAFQNNCVMPGCLALPFLTIFLPPHPSPTPPNPPPPAQVPGPLQAHDGGSR